MGVKTLQRKEGFPGKALPEARSKPKSLPGEIIAGERLRIAAILTKLIREGWEMALTPETNAQAPVKNQPDLPEGSEGKGPPSPSFDLVVSEDRLKAYLRIEGEGKDNLTIEDIKKFLTEKRILQGVVEDPALEEFLKSKAFFKDPCLVARGTPPEPGKDAQVTYHFEKDPLRIGIIKAGGGIDFKDKGEIPQVKAGTLLAEKVPWVKEKPGRDVYGEPLAVEPAKDHPLISGPGTKASADRLQVYAQSNGRPIISSDGKICVFSELKIPGDVGLETGHIRFDGFADIDGTIQAGFQVKAGRVAAKEILRTEVESDGDVVVNGGIIGAKVICRGNLKTRFIQSSQIEAGGDVIVEREIIDSKIEAHGAVIAQPAGKILSSQILATKGMRATQIGSESSKPCVLTVGIDVYLQGLIKKIQQEIAAKEGEQKKLKASIEVLNQASYRLKEDIVRWVQVQDRAGVEQRSCRKRMEELREKNDLSKVAQARLELEKLDEKVRSAEEPLKKLMEKEDLIMEKISGLQSQIKDVDRVIDTIQSEMKKALEESQKKEIPTIQVIEKIFPGTTLESGHCKAVLKETYHHVMIKETLHNEVSPEGNPVSSWGMQVYPLTGA